jgi:hypothetical protein
MAIGIMAFGSIAGQPGGDLEQAVVRRVAAETPFAVEFARSSRSRGGAPTLVPVPTGGARVPAVVLVLDDALTLPQAYALLYRRETHWPAEPAAVARVRWIAELPGFAGTSTCLYTALPANIEPLNAARLAELAVHSAAGPVGALRRDGISYLQQQKRRGVVTPLMPDYELAVLARTGERNLDDAWQLVVATPCHS